MSRQTTLPPRWAALAAAYGGVEPLAHACGVSQMTLWRWARGVRPSPLAVRAVSQMAARRKLDDPWTGIGKSTLLLQTAIDLSLAEVTNKETGAPEEPFIVLYVSAEETKSQIKGRAERLARASKRLYLLHQANVLEIDKSITEINPDVIIIDSIQTMVHPNAGDGGHAGSVTQVRACAEFIVNICRVRDIGCFMVAHINKEGIVAGPKTLEHLVDATLEFHKEGQGVG